MFKSEYNDSLAKREIFICKNPLSIATLALFFSVVMDFNWFPRNATEKNQFLVKLPYCQVIVRRVDRIQFTSKAAVKTYIENKVMSRLFLLWLNFCRKWQILIALKFPDLNFSRS